jgi:hypothetical protein
MLALVYIVHPSFNKLYYILVRVFIRYFRKEIKELFTIAIQSHTLNKKSLSIKNIVSEEALSKK